MPIAIVVKLAVKAENGLRRVGDGTLLNMTPSLFRFSRTLWDKIPCYHRSDLFAAQHDHPTSQSLELPPPVLLSRLCYVSNTLDGVCIDKVVTRLFGICAYRRPCSYCEIR